MPSYSKLIVIGHVTRDPETRNAGQSTVTAFGIAINSKYRTAAGEDREDVCFLDCEAWGKRGEVIAQYVTKGKPLFLEGRLTQQSWEAKDGTKRSKHVLTVDSFQFLGGRESEGEAEPAPKRSAAPTQRPAMGREKFTNRPAPADPFTGKSEFTDDSIPF